MEQQQPKTTEKLVGHLARVAGSAVVGLFVGNELALIGAAPEVVAGGTAVSFLGSIAIANQRHNARNRP